MDTSTSLQYINRSAHVEIMCIQAAANLPTAPSEPTMQLAPHTSQKRASYVWPSTHSSTTAQQRCKTTRRTHTSPPSRGIVPPGSWVEENKDRLTQKVHWR